MKPEVYATKEQIKEFIESVLWQDLVRELNVWKEGFTFEMMAIVDNAASANPSSASVLLHMGDVNGRIKAVDYFISLPNVLLQILEENSNDSRHKHPE